MDKNKSTQTVQIVNFFTTKYFYSPLYVKGAEEAVFLLGSPKQDYQLIIVTTENMIDHMAKQTLLNKVNLVVKKLETKPEKILILSYINKLYEASENNISIFHVFDNNIPKVIDELYPKMQDLDLFDEYYEKEIEKEKEQKEIDIKTNKIEDNSKIFANLGKSKTPAQSSIKEGGSKIPGMTKSLIMQNTMTKGLLIFTLIGALVLQFLLSAPAGSQSETLPVAFGGLYGPFVYGYDGIWRLFTYVFISPSVFTFIFVAIFFYFYSRMSESFYGTIRYLIIFIVGSALSGLVNSQIFQEDVIYGLGTPLWIFMGSTATFIVAKWRSVAVSIRTRFFLYLVFALFLSLFVNLGVSLEGGLISLIIGIVMGMAVQFNGSNFKLNWKKSINPLIASTILLVSAITVPLASNRKPPLESSLLNQSVFLTYEKYKVLSTSARGEFVNMNKSYYEISINRSNCLWNLNIINTTNEELTDLQKSKLNSSVTNLNTAFVAHDANVVQAINGQLDILIAQVDSTQYATLNNDATLLKQAYNTYYLDYSQTSFTSLNREYNDLMDKFDLEILTPQIQININRLSEIHTNIENWNNIQSSKTTLNLSTAIATFIEKPKTNNQRNVRRETEKLESVLNSNIFRVDFTQLKTVLSQELSNQSSWCFDLDS